MLKRIKPSGLALFSLWTRRLREECRGTSAIEFAIILPLMIALYVGAVEIGNALTIGRRADQVAYTSADLVAQARSLSNSDIRDITEAASSILAPYSTEPLSIVLTSVVADNKNRTEVAWSCTNGRGQARGKGSAVTLPDGLTEPGSSVIMAEVQYSYAPLLGTETGFEPFTMSRTFYTRPRRSDTVVKTGGNC
ncbi:MAG: TadE/TadG family type IV pilus assembly protein [Methyloligella sp. ZOD6]